MLLNSLFNLGGQLLRGDVAGAVQGVGLGDTDDGDENGGPSGHTNTDALDGSDQALKAPIDSCCGVIVHLFISSPQDLPAGAHDSSVLPVSSSSSGTDR